MKNQPLKYGRFLFLPIHSWINAIKNLLVLVRVILEITNVDLILSASNVCYVKKFKLLKETTKWDGQSSIYILILESLIF